MFACETEQTFVFLLLWEAGKSPQTPNQSAHSCGAAVEGGKKHAFVVVTKYLNMISVLHRRSYDAVSGTEKTFPC